MDIYRLEKGMQVSKYEVFKILCTNMDCYLPIKNMKKVILNLFYVIFSGALTIYKRIVQLRKYKTYLLM